MLSSFKGFCFLQNLLDKLGKTALDFCESITKTQWVASANLLRFAMSQPVSTRVLHKYWYLFIQFPSYVLETLPYAIFVIMEHNL